MFLMPPFSNIPPLPRFLLGGDYGDIVIQLVTVVVRLDRVPYVEITRGRPTGYLPVSEIMSIILFIIMLYQKQTNLQQIIYNNKT